MSTFDEVQNYLLVHPDSTARDIIAALPHINENSIGSALDRLYTEGTAERYKSGRYWLYYIEDLMTPAESQKLAGLESKARELEAKHLWRRAATTWLEAYDLAKSNAARGRYAKFRARCLSGMTRGVADASGSAPGNYTGGDL
jgi:hypothetical protein